MLQVREAGVRLQASDPGDSSHPSGTVDLPGDIEFDETNANLVSFFTFSTGSDSITSDTFYSFINKGSVLFRQR